MDTHDHKKTSKLLTVSINKKWIKDNQNKTHENGKTQQNPY